MKKPTTRTLNFGEFIQHMGECNVLVMDRMSGLNQIVIRLGDGTDHGLAAVHVEGTKLVMDLGKEMP